MVSNTCSPTPLAIPPSPEALVMLSLSKAVTTEHFVECVLTALATQAQDRKDRDRRGGGGSSPCWHGHLVSPFDEPSGTTGHISDLYG